MHRLVLTPSASSAVEMKVWREPDPNYGVIISCDPGLGRMNNNKKDSSSVDVWFRHPERRIEQVAKLLTTRTAYHVGLAIGALARWYGCGWFDGDTEILNATINIERNMCDVPLTALQNDQMIGYAYYFYPDEQRRRVKKGEHNTGIFTNKSASNEQYIINTLVQYFERDAIIIRDEHTLLEVATVYKDQSGRIETNGLDSAVSCMMAVVADAELPSIARTVRPDVEEDVREPEYGTVEWARKNAGAMHTAARLMRN